jgi:hypothetical protein
MAKQTTEETIPDATLPQVMAALADILRGNQDVQKAQLKQTAPKSNASVPLRSPFNPRGEKNFPMPLLKCDVYCPWKMTPTYHSLDREEVELFNLLEPGEYPVEMVDGSTTRVHVVGVRDSNTGTLERLALLGGKDDTGVHAGLFTNETRHNFPSLKSMLRQMVGEPADSVLTMKRESALIASGELAVSLGE